MMPENTRHFDFRYPSLLLVSLLIATVFSPGSLHSRAASSDRHEITLEADNVPLRLSPDHNSAVIRTLLRGTQISIEKRVGEWFRIDLPSDHEGHIITGYIHQADVPASLGPSGFERPAAVSTVRAAKGKRFQLDLQGGWSFIDPVADLNARPAFDLAYDDFTRVGYYDYWESQGELADWGMESEGDIKPIESALPFGCSLRYRIMKNFAISASFRYLGMTRKSIQRTYEHAEWTDGYSSRILTGYSPYILTIRSLMPMLGLHFVLQRRTLGIELGLLGGPAFASVGYSYDSFYKFYGDWEYWSQSTYQIKASGKNTGLALEGAVRANIFTSSTTGFFFEGAYSYQKTTLFSGPGSARYHYENSEGESDDDSDEWRGEWAMKEITYSESWGTLTSTLPSNSWDDLASNERRVRDFVLDLSGFQLKAGIFIRF